MLRFAIATVATFGLLMLISGNAVLSASVGSLGLIAEGVIGFEELAVTGEVYNEQGGAIPSSVSCTGAFTATANVDPVTGHFTAAVDAPPGTTGYVTVTATLNGETETKTVFVESRAGGGGTGGPF